MKKIFVILALAIMFVSCTESHVKRDIKNYEKQHRNTVESVEIKKCNSDYLWAAKIYYKTDSGLTTVPVYKLFSWDQYDYIHEWDDCEMKFAEIEDSFPECKLEQDYINSKQIYQNHKIAQQKHIYNDKRIIDIELQIDSLRQVQYKYNAVYCDFRNKLDSIYRDFTKQLDIRHDSCRQSTQNKIYCIDKTIDSLNKVGDSIVRKLYKENNIDYLE